MTGIPVHRQMTYERPPGLDGPDGTHPVVIVGAGPVGLALALDLARRGHRPVVLDRLDFVPGGSKAICFSKRSLDIFDRLGVGERVRAKGVRWETGHVFWGDDPEPIYSFDLQPTKDQANPAFVNIQQYHVEDYLLDACLAAGVEVLWNHEVASVTPGEDGVTVTARTPDGAYDLRADWLVACDGSRSAVREAMGLGFEGEVFEDTFLIADVAMEAERPAERWFWFDPPFPGDSALLHKQPDGVWRLDFQLGPGADKAAAIEPSNVDRFVRGMLGEDAAYRHEWLSAYTFTCRRMARFVHGRVAFAGDAAHLVSPFGARGCNGGLADADNLGWKLDRILRGADTALLGTYEHEAGVTADENILNSTRSASFLTPKTAGARLLRDAVLALSRRHAFARPFVNSGRLSTPVRYPRSPLNGPDEGFTGGVPPGAPCVDAPLNGGWLLERLGGRACLLRFAADEEAGASAPPLSDLPEVVVTLDARHALAAARYDAAPGTAYLVRPDQYVAARWRRATAETIAAAASRWHEEVRGTAREGEAAWA